MGVVRTFELMVDTSVRAAAPVADVISVTNSDSAFDASGVHANNLSHSRSAAQSERLMGGRLSSRSSARSWAGICREKFAFYLLQDFVISNCRYTLGLAGMNDRKRSLAFILNVQNGALNVESTGHYCNI